MIYTISDGILEVSINSAGGSMTSIKYRGEERQWQGGPAWAGQDVVIFPIVGHAGPYTVQGREFAPRSHGVARYSEFALKEIKSDSLTLSLESDKKTKETYPFDFYFEIGYKLSGGALKVSYGVWAGEGKIPFYVGGHPGLIAPCGRAAITFENEESPVVYPIGGDSSEKWMKIKSFEVDKAFFAKHKTLQLGNLSGGKICARTDDGVIYSYKSDCPVWAFWSNESEGDYICVEPWWGINDFPAAPRELSLKPFMNFADKNGRKFSYSLAIEKVEN